MSHKFYSKMLAIVSTFTLILGTYGTIPAQAQTNVSLPSCFISGAGGTVANISMSVGQLCIDDGKIKKLFKECKGSDATSSFDFSRCIKSASKSEISAQFSVAAGSINVCPNSGTGTCSTVDVGGGAGGNGGGNGGPGGRTNVNGGGGNPGGGGGVAGNAGGNGGGGGGSNRTGGSTGGGGSGRTGTRTGDARVDAQVDVDILSRHCGDSGDLMGYDATRQTDLDGIVESLKNYSSSCTGPDCVNLTALKTAMNTSLNQCHSGCIHIALDSTSACYWKNLTGANRFQNENEFCQVMTAHETDSRVTTFMAAYPGNQNDCTTLSNANTDTGAVCRSILGDSNCAQVMRSDAFQCDGFKGAADAYYSALATYNQLIADQKSLNGPSNRGCKIASAADASKAYDNRDNVSLKCLIDIEASCSAALDAAQSRLDTVVANQKTWCPTCNANQQSQTCSYGGNCSGNGGISKGAQWAAALAPSIASLGNGLFGMLAYNKGVNACASSNAALIAAQTAQSNATLDLYKNVGLTGPINPISAQTCGTGSFGMGGFGGIGGMSGIGGYSPYGLGMGGMSGLGGMGGYSPYGNSLGLSGSLGLGGLGMGGMGYSPYGQSGLGLGMGMGLGLGTGMGYSPYGQSQYGLGLGMSSPYGQMGLGGLGMGTGYSPYGQMGLGMTSPYGLNSGLMSGNLMQSQQNMSSVYQQMQMQNQLINQSAYTQNPFMSGMYGSSPYSQYGLSSYNPYSMYGLGGQGAGISGGFNLSLPSISIGSGGYGSGYYGMGSSCGYYSGVPCAGY